MVNGAWRYIATMEFGWGDVARARCQKTVTNDLQAAVMNSLYEYMYPVAPRQTFE